MKRTLKLGARLLAVLVIGVTLSGIAWANGAEFFTPGEAPDLYYFGHIKDSTGKVLDGVTVTVKAKNVGMSFPVRNDTPGHFRTADIGRAIKGFGKTVDATQIEIAVTKAGYRQVQPSSPAAPSKITGGVLVEFVMEPVETSAK